MELADVLATVGAVLVGFGVYIVSRWTMRKDNQPGMDYGGKLGRRMGSAIERGMYMMCKQGSLLLCNVLFIVTKQPLFMDNMAVALKKMALRHPLLRMKVKPCGQDLHFVEMEDFKIDFSMSDTENWVSEFERQFTLPYNTETGPLWRAVYLPKIPPIYATSTHPHQYVIAFGFNHAIVDGTSYCRIFNELIDDLEDIADGGSGSDPQSQSLPPPMSDCLPEQMKLPLGKYLQAKCLGLAGNIPSVKQYMMKKIGSSMPHNPWVEKRGEESDRDPNCQHATSMIPMVLDSDLSQRILANCKRNGSTVQGAVQLASMAAMAQFLDCCNEEREWRAIVTVNLRSVFPEAFSTAHVAPYFGGIEVAYKLPSDWKENFWQYAKEVSEQIHKDLKQRVVGGMHRFAILRSLQIRPPQLAKFSGNGSRTQCFMAFTNLGNCNYLNRAETNSVQLKARFGGSAEHRSGNTMASNIMTLDGKIFWSLVFYKNVMKEEEAAEIGNLIQAIIGDACKQ